MVSLRGDSDAVSPPSLRPGQAQRLRPSSRLPPWLRLQITLGAVPLAGYLSFHLVTQLSALWGPNAHGRWGALPVTAAAGVLEIILIYLPLGLHVGLGLRRVLQPAPASAALEVSALARQLMRLSGAVLLIFMLIHVAEFRLRLWASELAPSDYYPELCARLSSTRWGGVPITALGHLLGVAAAAHYGAQGLYQGLLGLGLVAASSAGTLRRSCIALGLCWFGLGALIVIDLATGSVLIHLAGS